MEPTKKHPNIDKFLEDVMGKSRPDTIRKFGCMTCNTPNLTFKDELSKREYAISGMCQTCQDETFKEEE